jgi:pimeloyl-[acyl-carrier protein] synthase
MNEAEASGLTAELFSPDGRADPYRIYDRLRELDPVHFNPFVRMWFLTRHADCVTVLRDRRFSAELGQQLRQRDEKLPRSMLTTDPPEHTRLRKPANEAFATRNLEGLRARLPGLVAESLGPFAEGDLADLVSTFARTYAARVLAELLEVPGGDFDRFAELTFATAANLDPLAPQEEQQHASVAARALGEYFHRRLAGAGPQGGGVLGVLLTARDRGELAPEEVVSLCVLCVVGGHEPLAGLVVNGLLTLLQHPGQLVRIRGDGAFDAAVVDEVLRFESPIQFVARVARDDVTVDGRTIHTGEPVLALLGAANRDPAVFGDGRQVDVGRPANPHLAFGAGVHRCLGAAVTELAARAAIGGVVRRFPRLELAADEVQWRSSLVPRAPASLPVRL